MHRSIKIWDRLNKKKLIKDKHKNKIKFTDIIK